MSSEASDVLHRRVRAFMRASLAPAGSPMGDRVFDALALDIARFQAAHVPPFARLVRARGVDLASARSAADIPAVPTDVFKHARVAAHDAALDTAVFRTSGTTVKDHGEHALRTTETYALGALAWGARFLWPDGVALGAIVLAAPPSAQPGSSLGFMLDLFARALTGPSSWHVTTVGPETHLDVAGVLRAAADARATARPTLVLATSFALVHLLDDAGGTDLRLPTGSRVMQTGGFKGRSREVDPEALRAQVAAAFGVPETHVVSEYGMTELSSQLYEGTLARSLGSGPPNARAGVHHAPAWMRVEAVHPESLEPVPHGDVGIGRVIDLANVDSAVAIQTADRVRVGLDGSVEVLGRLAGSTPRGCSIALDEMLGGA